MFSLTQQLIDPCALGAALRERGSARHCGAYVSFEGWVRDHHQGRAVTGLHYTAYDALALSEGRAILTDALSRFEVEAAQCVHRTGDLAIGDCAVWVGVTAAHRDAAYAANRWIIDAIKARVPIWKHEHYASGESAWVGCAGCRSTSKDRYARQRVLPELGNAGQAALAQSHAVVFGLGALGCPAADALVRAGVGRITLIDGDTVALHNLHRQTLFTESDIGRLKVDTAAARLRMVNASIRIDPIGSMADVACLESTLSTADLVLDCTDSPASKQLVSTLARARGVPCVLGGVDRWSGVIYESPENPGDGLCWDCLSGFAAGNCAERGVLGSVTAQIGSQMATAALRRLIGAPGLRGQLLVIDAAGGVMQAFRPSARPQCDCEVINIEQIDQIADSDTVVDLRTAAERAAQPFVRADAAVESESLLDWIARRAVNRLVLVCASGQRSTRAATMLHRAGQTNVCSLAGGVGAATATACSHVHGAHHGHAGCAA